MAKGSSRAVLVQELLAVRDRLCSIPNVGPATAQDLIRLGIRRVEQLAEQDPDELFGRLAQLDGRAHDPCVRDVFAAAIAYARDGTVRPWWHYTRERQAAKG